MWKFIWLIRINILFYDTVIMLGNDLRYKTINKMYVQQEVSANQLKPVVCFQALL